MRGISKDLRAEKNVLSTTTTATCFGARRVLSSTQPGFFPMNRDEFFQQAMLRMADAVLMRADTVPTPEQLAKKAREYAQALHDEMLAGLTKLDMLEETTAKPRPRTSVRSDGSGVPTLAPARLSRAAPQKSSTYDDPDDDDDAPECPRCNGLMKKRNGRNGAFWGCTDYPNCNGTKNIE